MYAAGRWNIFISDDGGRTWASVTSSNGQSILGGEFTSLAVSPANPQEIVVANAFGLWRSADGGISWRSLNEGFPNLPVRKLAGRRMILLANGSAAELTAGDWTSSADLDPEAALRARFTLTAGAEITAAAQTSTVSYAGTADGRLLASRDNGATWSDVHTAGTAPVNRIWADATQPELALAAAGGHLLRTLNGGGFWDDISGSLPDPNINGIAADRLTDHVWIATGRGVFETRVALLWDDENLYFGFWAGSIRRRPGGQRRGSERPARGARLTHQRDRRKSDFRAERGHGVARAGRFRGRLTATGTL